MDVIKHFHLPANFPALSVMEMSLIVLATLCAMAVITSLVAFVASMPKSTFIRAFFAVIVHLIFTSVLIAILFYLKRPPNQEITLIVAFVAATITFSTFFVSTIVRGAICAIITGGLYFLVYKCTILYLMSQQPDIYIQYTEILGDFAAQYELYRF
jgi:ABC-type amino acid transport system permease subunit